MIWPGCQRTVGGIECQQMFAALIAQPANLNPHLRIVRGQGQGPIIGFGGGDQVAIEPLQHAEQTPAATGLRRIELPWCQPFTGLVALLLLDHRFAHVGSDVCLARPVSQCTPQVRFCGDAITAQQCRAGFVQIIFRCFGQCQQRTRQCREGNRQDNPAHRLRPANRIASASRKASDD